MLGLENPGEDVGTLFVGTRMWVTVVAGARRDGDSSSLDRAREGEEVDEEEESEVEEEEGGGVWSLVVLIC